MIYTALFRTYVDVRLLVPLALSRQRKAHHTSCEPPRRYITPPRDETELQASFQTAFHAASPLLEADDRDGPPVASGRTRLDIVSYLTSVFRDRRFWQSSCTRLERRSPSLTHLGAAPCLALSQTATDSLLVGALHRSLSMHKTLSPPFLDTCMTERLFRNFDTPDY